MVEEAAVAAAGGCCVEEGRGADQPPSATEKQRTISSSTEESGVESLSPPPPSSTHQSEAESETSDYLSSTPSPALPVTTEARGRSSRTRSEDGGGRDEAAMERSRLRYLRRLTVPGCGSAGLLNLRVSLAKLPASTLLAHLRLPSPQPTTAMQPHSPLPSTQPTTALASPQPTTTLLAHSPIPARPPARPPATNLLGLEISSRVESSTDSDEPSHSLTVSHVATTATGTSSPCRRSQYSPPPVQLPLLPPQQSGKDMAVGLPRRLVSEDDCDSELCQSRRQPISKRRRLSSTLNGQPSLQPPQVVKKVKLEDAKIAPLGTSPPTTTIQRDTDVLNVMNDGRSSDSADAGLFNAAPLLLKRENSAEEAKFDIDTADARPAAADDVTEKKVSAVTPPKATDLLMSAAAEMKLEIVKIDQILEGRRLLNTTASGGLKGAEVGGLKAEKEAVFPTPLKEGFEPGPPLIISAEPEKEAERLPPAPHQGEEPADRRWPASLQPAGTGGSGPAPPEEVEQEAGLRCPAPPEEEVELISCKWSGCQAELEDTHLLEHLNVAHVAGQCGAEGKVQCLWAGCKVYGALSSSTTWLTNHVTSHIGSKPFRCIVDACRQRFASQLSLSRHVNSHFKPPQNPPGAPPHHHHRRSGGPADTSTPLRFLVRKTRRKPPVASAVARQRSAESLVDPFHVGMMAGVRDALARVKRQPRHARCAADINFDGSGTAVIFYSRVMGRRLDENGNLHYLISWLPAGMLEEEWVAEENFKARKKVNIIHLPAVAKSAVEEHVFGRKLERKCPRKTLAILGPPRLT